jgi:hypothetical protein
MKLLTTFTLLLTITAVGAAQENAPQEESQEQIPVTITYPASGSPRGEVPPETPGEHGVPRNSVQVGVNVYGSYDNYGDAVSGSGSTIGEGMVFRLNSENATRRTVFEYRPSFSYRTGGGQSQSFAHDFTANTLFRLGRHWTLRMDNQYRITTDPFQASGTTLPSLEAPNTTIAIPYANQTSEFATAELGWLATKHMSIGLVGNFGMQRYGEVAGLASSRQPLLDSTNSSGRVYVRYAFTKRFTAGLEGQYQDLLTDLNSSRVQSYSVVAYTNFQLTKHSQITIFGGPQRSHLRNQLFLDFGFFRVPFKVARWSTEGTGGATYSLQMKHSRFYTTYSNRITDGGGLIGPVTLNSAAVGVDHDFSPKWSGGLGFDFGNNSALGVTNTIRTYAGSVSVRRRVSRDMNFSVSYQNVNQDQTPHQPGFITGNHNRVYASLEYVWSHPLGR